MTALIGSVIGLAAVELGRTDLRRNLYLSPTYGKIHQHRNYAIVFGVGGFIIGAGQQCLRELKDKRDHEQN
ncbi:MAG: hypothetical protein AAGG02_04060 [Cyanobacteria bacterium P01_H01_bin.15]